MGPRSKMAAPPEPAYRAGPKSRLQALNPSFDQPPPPPQEPPPEAAYRAGPKSRLQMLNPSYDIQQGPPPAMPPMHLPPPGAPPGMPPMHLPPPGVPPPVAGSTPAYRPGPKSRLQFLNQELFNQAPPPPPPSGAPPGGSMPPQKNQNITQDDISSFMDQWVEQPPTTTYSNPPPSGPKIIDHSRRPSQEPPQDQPSAPLNSALAKLRAKKAAKAKQQTGNQYDTGNQAANYSYSQTNFNSFNPAARSSASDFPSNGGQTERNFHERSYRSWNMILERNWSYFMEGMFNELWVSANFFIFKYG